MAFFNLHFTSIFFLLLEKKKFASRVPTKQYIITYKSSTNEKEKKRKYRCKYFGELYNEYVQWVQLFRIRIN